MLSDNRLEQAQTNTVVPSQKEMDWVGFEPTTSATEIAALSSCLFLLPRTISTHMQLTLSFGSYGQILSQVQKLGYSSKTTSVNG